MGVEPCRNILAEFQELRPSAAVPTHFRRPTRGYNSRRLHKVGKLLDKTQELVPSSIRDRLDRHCKARTGQRADAVHPL